MEPVDIDNLLENGRLRFRVWRRLSVAQRRYVLGEIDDEYYDVSVLDGIAIPLRVAELPDDYSNVQIGYLSENRIELSRDVLVREIEGIREMVGEMVGETRELMTKIVSRKRSIYYGWEVELDDVCYEDRNYRVFKDEGYKGNVLRYLVEPVEENQNPKGYFDVLEHLVVDNLYFRNTIEYLHPTIVLEILDEHGRASHYSFDIGMGIWKLVHELHRIFDDQETYLARISLIVSKISAEYLVYA